MPIEGSAGTLDIENATLRSNAIAVLANLVTGNDRVRESGAPALEVYGDPSHGGNEARLELVSNTATVSSSAFTRLTSNAGVLSVKTGTDASDNGTITFGGFANERLRIGSDGNVGIGTTSPDGKLHIQDTSPLDFKGITYTSSDVKTVITNDSLSATNASMIQVYKGVGDRTPSAIDFHSEENFNASNVYTLCLNPRGGRIGLNDMNPNSDLTIGARFYNTKGYVGIIGDGSNPTVYKGDPNNATTTLPYTQLSTNNPVNGSAYYFINPYPGEAQCTIVYDNAQTSANGLIYFYCNGPNYQPSTYLAHSSSGNSEFTIPLLETGALRGTRVNAIHMKPVNGTQIRIVAVYWVPYRGVTANIKDGGKLVLGTVGGFGTPGGALTFRSEYETPTGNQLEPRPRVDNGIAWMTDLSTWYNGGLGGNGINWNKNNATYGVSVGARIWYQPGSFTSSASGSAGNHGSLYLSAGYSTGTSNTPSIAIKSSGRVGIGITNPDSKLEVRGVVQASYSNTDHGVFVENSGNIKRDYGGYGAGFHLTDNKIWAVDYTGTYNDGGIAWGDPNYRWGQIYSTQSTIATSDRNLKQDITDITDSERRVASKIIPLLKTYRMKDAVEKKGDEARTHTGIIAQDLITVFESEGLDAHRYGLLCYDEKWTVDGEHELTETVYKKYGSSEYTNEEGNVVNYTVDDEGVEAVKHKIGIFANKDTPGAILDSTIYSIRYEELLCFIVSAMATEEKVTTLETQLATVLARLDALESA